MGKKKNTKLKKMDIFNVRDDFSDTSSNSAIWAKDQFKSEEENESEEDASEFNNLDEKLGDIIEKVGNKNINSRLPALHNLKKLMQSHFIPEIIADKTISLLSLLERCIRREHSNEERSIACENVALYFVQTIFFANDSDYYWDTLELVLANVYKYDSNPIQVRESAASAHSFVAFIMQSREQTKITGYMDTLESLFKRATPKAKNVHTQLAAKTRDLDSHVPLHVEAPDQKNERINNFRASALRGWTLLLTICSENVATQKIGELVQYITQEVLGDSASPLPLKIAAAECLAVCNELDSEAFEKDGSVDQMKQDLNMNNSPQPTTTTLARECINLLEILVGDNPKYTSKRDQRTSRNLFRRVLHSFRAVHPEPAAGQTENSADAPNRTATVDPSSPVINTSVPDNNNNPKGILKTSQIINNNSHSNDICDDSTTLEHIKNLTVPDTESDKNSVETGGGGVGKKATTFNPEVTFKFIPPTSPLPFNHSSMLLEGSFLGCGSHEYDTFRTEIIKFGHNEALTISDWVSAIRYEAFCSLLGHGTNLHLRENDLVRQIFNLGPALPQSQQGPTRLTKEDKIARDVKLTQIQKDRTLYLAKARRFKNQVRTAALHDE